MTPDSSSGFKRRTRLAEARDRLLETIDTSARVESIALEAARNRTLAEEITAPRPVPHYRRAAMDGYAVRGEETFGASDRTPVRFVETGEATAIDARTARYVNTGDELPAGADAVVMVEDTDVDESDLEVYESVAVGENVAPIGEDITEGESVLDAGKRLSASDLALCKSLGIGAVPIAERPRVCVLPTGEELVQENPDPGEIIETNGFMVSELVAEWGGLPRYREVVTDERDALENALENEIDSVDLIVTTGGSSVGERDLVVDVLDSLGETLVHGVALEPGYPVGIGVIEGVPVITLPGYPLSCFVNANQFVRPAIERLGAMGQRTPHTTRARLDSKVPSSVGVRSFVPVSLDAVETEPDRSDAATGDGETTEDGATVENGATTEDGTTAGDETDDPVRFRARRVRGPGAGALSSAANADGWLVVEEQREGLPEGASVGIEDWNALR